MAELHITRSQRIIEKHLGMRRIGVEPARDTVKELALKADQVTELKRDQRLREEQEKATGLPVANSRQSLTHRLNARGRAEPGLGRSPNIVVD